MTFIDQGEFQKILLECGTVLTPIVEKYNLNNLELKTVLRELIDYVNSELGRKSIEKVFG